MATTKSKVVIGVELSLEQQEQLQKMQRILDKDVLKKKVEFEFDKNFNMGKALSQGKIDTSTVEKATKIYGDRIDSIISKAEAKIKSSQDKMSKRMNSATSKLLSTSLSSNTMLSGDMSGKTDTYMSKLGELKETSNQLTKIKLEMNQAFNTGIVEDFDKAYGNFTEKLKESKSIIKELGSSKFNISNPTGKNKGEIIDDLSISNIKEAKDYLEGLHNSANKAIYSTNSLTDEGTKLRQKQELLNGTIKETVRWFDAESSQMRMTTNYYGLAESGVDRLKSTMCGMLKTFAGFFSAYKLFSYIVRGLRDGIDTVRDMDVAFTEMRKVSNDTTEELKEFSKVSHDIAQAIGSTGLELQNSAADWMKLGYSIHEASELAKNSALYSNVGDMDIDTATEHMLSTLKAFDVEADKSLEVVDKFNAVGNNYAITSEGIGAALERSAASLVAAGNTLDQSIGMITAGNIISQDPEMVGNALKVDFCLHIEKSMCRVA